MNTPGHLPPSFSGTSGPPGTLHQPPPWSSSPEAPFHRIRGLGSRTRFRVFLALLIAVVAHGASAAPGLSSLPHLKRFAKLAQSTLRQRRIQSIDVFVETKPEPIPEVEAPKERKVRTRPAPRKKRRRSKRRAPPPAAAQASRVLTAAKTPEEPLDLTGNTFIQGTANSYAGGVTASRGTSKTAVRNLRAKGSGVAGGRGSIRGADLSRPARPLRNHWKNCPFPAAADLEQINREQVRVEVVVTGSGRARSARAIKDPGHGFGRAAQRCAKRHRYAPELNRQGKSVVSKLIVTVKFTR